MGQFWVKRSNQIKYLELETRWILISVSKFGIVLQWVLFLLTKIKKLSSNMINQYLVQTCTATRKIRFFYQTIYHKITSNDKNELQIQLPKCEVFPRLLFLLLSTFSYLQLSEKSSLICNLYKYVLNWKVHNRLINSRLLLKSQQKGTRSKTQKSYTQFFEKFSYNSVGFKPSFRQFVIAWSSLRLFITSF